MVLKITKDTWEKCGIKTNFYYDKEKVLALWLKMNYIEKK